MPCAFDCNGPRTIDVLFLLFVAKDEQIKNPGRYSPGVLILNSKDEASLEAVVDAETNLEGVVATVGS
jgi:hypothetical protein